MPYFNPLTSQWLCCMLNKRSDGSCSFKVGVAVLYVQSHAVLICERDIQGSSLKMDIPEAVAA